jgi:hypothetical protein
MIQNKERNQFLVYFIQNIILKGWAAEDVLGPSIYAKISFSILSGARAKAHAKAKRLAQQKSD